MALSRDGHYLYVVDQGSFQGSRHRHDQDRRPASTPPATSSNPTTSRRSSGTPRSAATRSASSLEPDDRTLLVTNVGVFQYTHLRPRRAGRRQQRRLPALHPGVGYPDEVETPKTIKIKKIDASTISGLPTTLRDPDGIRCGYVPADVTYTIPALGSPNAPESSSVYVLDVSQPARRRRCAASSDRAAPSASDEDGIAAYGAQPPERRGRRAAGASTCRTATTTRSPCWTARPNASRSTRSRWRCCPARIAVLKGVAAGVAGAQPRPPLPLRRRGGPERGRRSSACDGQPARRRPHPDRLVAEQREGQPRRRDACSSPAPRGAAPGRTSTNQAPKHSVLGTVNVIAVPGARPSWPRTPSR